MLGKVLLIVFIEMFYFEDWSIEDELQAASSWIREGQLLLITTAYNYQDELINRYLT